jgi:hypothetical protein
MITQKIKSHDDRRSATWICSIFPTMIYFIDQRYMNPSKKTSAPEQTTFEIKHYIIHDEVQRGERDSPIHISMDEQINIHLGKAYVQDKRVCVLKLELVETNSLLKKEEMNLRLGGSIDMYRFMGPVIFQFEKWSSMSSFLSSSESGSRLLTDNDFSLWLTW